MQMTGTGRSSRAKQSRLAAAVALSLSMIAIAGCGDDDDTASDMSSVGSDQGTNDGSGGSDTGSDNGNPGSMGAVPSGSFAVARNASGMPGSVQFFMPDVQTSSGSLSTAANEGIAFDGAGGLYQNGDGASFTGLRAFGRVAVDADGRMFDPTLDRDLSSTPGKGLTVVDASGVLVSCDVTDASADIKIFATTAGEGAAPIATIDTDSPVWDVFYHATADRLYAARTDGVLQVFDDFSVNMGNGTVRMITPVDSMGNKVSVNFHGVFADGVTVVVTDVGDAGSADDGAMFVFTDNGGLDGTTTSFGRVAGNSTVLGNPVDVVLSNGSAIIAEKSNDALLVFNSIDGRTGEFAPDYRFDFTKPESIELFPTTTSMTDSTDIDSPGTLSAIAVALNPGPQQGGANDAVGSIRLLDASLNDTGGFSAGAVAGAGGAQQFRTLENIQFDGLGNAYAVVDTTDGSTVTDRGILVLHQLANRDGQAVNTPDRDRLIGNASLGLTSPKGIEIDQSRGAMIVADVGGSPSLRVYSLAAGANAAPMFVVDSVGAGAIWDVDYDPASDRLYAAGTAGDILVYDNFFAMGSGAIPSRTIRPDSAGATSNIHGIVHVAASDQLIVSDVGDAGVASDGKVYVIDAASTASGTVTPRSTLSGPASMLGNPVDLAYDGANLYIAEKSNDKVMMVANVLSLSGDITTAPDASIDLTKPESVSIQRR
ncbi:MAG: hypothetical protein R3E87_23780 [Burkholderiaceae bacterium]